MRGLPAKTLPVTSLAALAVLLAPAGVAWACSPPLPEPPSARVLLPAPDAVDVPTDAVLVVLGLPSLTQVTLQAEGSAQALGLRRECHLGFMLCLAYPEQPLAAHTTYHWSASLQPGNETREGRFTTGAGPRAPAVPELAVRHAGFDKGSDSCGRYDLARFTLQLPGSAPPARLLVWPQPREPRMTTVPEDPLILEAHAEQQLSVQRSEVCLQVVHLDAAGRPTPLGRHCPEAADEDGDDGFLGGCAAAGGAGTLLPALGLLLTAAGRARRRRIPG